MKPKVGSLKKINKIYRLLVRLTKKEKGERKQEKKKKEKKQASKPANLNYQYQERKSTDPTEIKRTRRDY